MKKIGVIKGSSIGDILTGIPLLRSLKKAWPDSEIYVPDTKDSEKDGEQKIIH